MKRGLVSPGQPAYTTYNRRNQGASIGPYIVQVVDVADEFDVGLPFYWVDCPDETVPYLWYYDVGTSTSIGGSIVTYYSTVVFTPVIQTNRVGQEVLVWPPATPAPPDTTASVPPTVPNGQTLYWYSSAWVVASFDPSLTLPQAKSSLISQVTQLGAAAVNTQLGLYSSVQQIEAADVLALDTLDYPGTTIGEYQTYVDGLIASSTATINAAVSTTALYSFNPAEVPFTPTASGTISGSRTGNDFNDSSYVTFVSDTLTAADTELFMPATSTVIPYILPTQFAGFSEAFGGGNYTVQIRQAATGFVLAEYICPAGPPNVVVSF